MTGRVESETSSSDEVSPVEQDELQVTDNVDEGDQTPEEAEASFAKGFEIVSGETDDKSEESEAKEEPAEPEIKPEASEIDDVTAEQDQPQTPAQDKESRALAKRMRKIEGKFGGINDALDKLSRNIGAGNNSNDTETKQEVAKSLKHIKELEESISEFKELAPFKEQMEELSKELADLKNGQGSGGNDPSLRVDDVAELVGKELLNTQYPDWEADTKTPEFRAFMLSGGGPSEEEFNEWAALRSNPQTAAEAEELMQDWKEDRPGWWKGKGEIIFSDKSRDSIKVLNMYSSSMSARQEQESKQASQSQRRQNRLRSSLTPGKGAESNPVTGLTDEEAFANGVKKVQSKRL